MLKKILIIIPFLLLISTAAHAQCTGSGSAWSCPNGATPADVATAISSGTSTGPTNPIVITFAAGTYSGHKQTPSTNTSVGIICATAPPSSYPWGAASVNPCTFTSTAAITGSSFGPGVNTNSYRVSGFVFD